MVKIYHNPRCKKSRAGLQYLKDKNVEFEVVEYLKDPLAEAELKDILIKMNKKPADITRTQEEVYRKSFRGKEFTDDEWISILLEHPKLIQRPIVVKGYKAVLGDPAENIEDIL